MRSNVVVVSAALVSCSGLTNSPLAPSSPMTNTMPVMEHTMMVSRKVPVIDTSACRTG